LFILLRFLEVKNYLIVVGIFLRKIFIFCTKCFVCRNEAMGDLRAKLLEMRDYWLRARAFALDVLVFVFILFSWLAFLYGVSVSFFWGCFWVLGIMF